LWLKEGNALAAWCDAVVAPLAALGSLPRSLLHARLFLLGSHFELGLEIVSVSTTNFPADIRRHGMPEGSAECPDLTVSAFPRQRTDGTAAGSVGT
jgi:hypothetical protein